MGTPPFAVPTLEALRASHQVVAVFTQPDKPAGRGKKMRPSAVKTAALDADLMVYQPENINSDDSYQLLANLNIDIVIVVAYGQILKPHILEVAPFGCLNVHASLLPRWRGASPIQSAIVAGDKQTGVTIMQMDAGLDSGDILNVSPVAITPDMTAGQLHDQLMDVGAKALIETLESIKKGMIKPVKQDEALVTYAPLINKKDAAINWQVGAEAIANMVRGYNPWPTAYTTLGGVNLKIHRATALADKPLAEVGVVERVDDNYIYVSCHDGVLRIEEIQPQNKKKMTVAAYLRGNQVEVGAAMQSSRR